MNSNVNFKMKLDEEIFLYVNYKDKSNFIKIAFKSNPQYHLLLVKESISAAFEGVYVDDCNFYWDDVFIPEKDLVQLIKAKQFCGQFRISVKERVSEIDETNETLHEEILLERTCRVTELPKTSLVATVVSSEAEPFLKKNLVVSSVKSFDAFSKEMPSCKKFKGNTVEEAPEFMDIDSLKVGNSPAKNVIKSSTESTTSARVVSESSQIIDEDDSIVEIDSDDEEIEPKGSKELLGVKIEEGHSDMDSDMVNMESTNLKRIPTDDESELPITQSTSTLEQCSKKRKSKSKKKSSSEHFKVQVAKLKEHFNADVKTKILLLDDPMTPVNRKNILGVAVQYLFDEVGIYPNVAQRNQLVKILVEVFKPYKRDEDLVIRWVTDKVSNMRRRIKRDEGNISKLLEDSKKRKLEDTEVEDSSTDDDDASSFASSFSGVSYLSASKMRQYIKSGQHSSLLLIAENEHAEPSIRKKIIAACVQFLFDECGLYPSLAQKRTVIKLVSEVFLGLNDEEQVKRWFNDRIINVRKRNKQLETTYHESLDRVRILTGELRIEDQMKFLESCSEIDDIQKIQDALRDTLAHRIEQGGIVNFNVFNTYKFFSKSLDLILYDFNIRFPTVQDNLLDNFELVLDAASSIYKLEIKPDLPGVEHSMDIRKFLAIFHYTKTPVGAKKQFTILDMLEAFITFSIIDDDKKPEFKDHPIIIAQGYSKTDIWKYFIQIENALIELPEQTKFIEAFDYLIRSYYVFSVEFPKVLLVFLNFIMINMYDINNKSRYQTKKPKIEDLPLRPRDLWRKIQKHINDMK